MFTNYDLFRIVYAISDAASRVFVMFVDDLFLHSL